MPVLATSFALSGRIGIGMPVLATLGPAVRLAVKLRSPTALANANNTKTTNISHLFIESPRVWNYQRAGFYVVLCCQGVKVRTMCPNSTPLRSLRNQSLDSIVPFTVTAGSAGVNGTFVLLEWAAA